MAARVALFLCFLLAGWISDPRVYAAQVVISCGSVGTELVACREGAESWARKTGNSVEVLASPASSGERLGQMQLLLAAKGSDIDVFLIDTTWPGILGEFLVDLKARPEAHEVESEHFVSFIRNNTVNGRLVALPWFIDAGLLFYRKDLLKKYGERPPATWTELTRVAQRIQDGERRAGHSKFWGYVFQGRAYEGLTCNALEWVRSWGGGTIVDEAGQITIDNPQAARALELASGWVGRISPRGALNYMEEDARAVFQSGNAAFLRNWPYAWKLGNAPDSAVRGKIGMQPLPQGDGPGARSVATLGGWSLAVSRYSRHPDEAIGLILYLTGREEQKRRVQALGQFPARPALYRDPELLKSNSQLPELFQVFDRALPRPSAVIGPRYNRVSSEVWESVHRILSGETPPRAELGKLQGRLEFLRRGGKW